MSASVASIGPPVITTLPELVAAKVRLMLLLSTIDTLSGNISL